MTIGEARGFAEVISHYPHLTMRDQWDPARANEAVEIESANGVVPMVVTIWNDGPTGYRFRDTWQVLRNGHIDQLTRGHEVLV